MTATPGLRVLHVVATLDAGGTEMWALRLLEHWQGHVEQEVVVLDRAAGILEPQFAALAPLRILSDARGSTIFRAVRSGAQRFGADAVLIHNFGTPHLAAALAARSLGIRSVAASAGNPPPGDRLGRMKWAAVLAGSRALGCPVAGCSNAVDAQLRALGVGMPAGSRAIPYGIATDGASPPRPTRPITQLGMVARLDEIKDHATLLRAFAEVIRIAPATRLTLIGDGALRGELERLAERLGLGDAVRFLGRRVDVAALLEQLDVFVFSTTRAEGFGIVLIEAMAKGLPIVASDVPACREVLDGGAAGRLASAGDATALAAAILDLIDDPAAAAELARRGRARVDTEYSVETCAGRWLDILRQNRVGARE